MLLLRWDGGGGGVGLGYNQVFSVRACPSLFSSQFAVSDKFIDFCHNVSEIV